MHIEVKTSTDRIYETIDFQLHEFDVTICYIIALAGQIHPGLIYQETQHSREFLAAEFISLDPYRLIYHKFAHLIRA